MPGPAAILLQATLHQASTCIDRCLSNWKIGFAALLFIEAVVFGNIIYGLKRATASSSQKFSYVFHLGHALSGGVFFAAGVLHILPEAIALLNGEHVHGEGEDEHEDDHEHSDEERWLAFRQEEDDDHHDDEGEDSHGDFPWAFLILMLSFYVIFFIERLVLPKILASKAVKTDEEAGTPDEVGQLTSDSVPVKDISDLPTETKGFSSPEFVSGLIDILGISAHSLFESIALGLSGSFSTVLNIFIATAAHRWATASALGFKLLKSLNYFPFLVLLLIFSSIAPIGIGIGAALGNLSQSVQGVLFAISAGTFIYIGVFEVMAEEFVAHQKWHMTKFLMTMIGASTIIVITVILNVLEIHA